MAKEQLGELDTQKMQQEMRQGIYRVREEVDNMLQEVRRSHEHYQKRQNQLFTGIGAILLVFMLFALIMTIGSDFMSFLRIDTLQNVIADKTKASEGFMTFIWYIAYGLPYVLAIGLFIGLYEWLKSRFHD